MQKNWIIWISGVFFAPESQKSDPDLLKRSGSTLDHLDHMGQVIQISQKRSGSPLSLIWMLQTCIFAVLGDPDLLKDLDQVFGLQNNKKSRLIQMIQIFLNTPPHLGEKNDDYSTRSTTCLLSRLLTAGAGSAACEGQPLYY
jgi:hypothetical protein